MGTLTYLTTDIEASRRLARQDPAAMRTALANHNASLHKAVEAHGGMVFEMLGDGVYASFRTPLGAVCAAIESQAAIQRDGPLRVRMAIHTGKGQSALRRCLRLLGVANGGQVLVTLETVEVMRDSRPSGAELRPLGVHRTHEFSRPEHVFQVLQADLRLDVRPLRSAWHQRWRRYLREVLKRADIDW